MQKDGARTSRRSRASWIRGGAVVGSTVAGGAAGTVFGGPVGIVGGSAAGFAIGCGVAWVAPRLGANGNGASTQTPPEAISTDLEAVRPFGPDHPLMSLIGTGASGRSDVAEQHDKYLHDNDA